MGSLQILERDRETEMGCSARAVETDIVLPSVPKAHNYDERDDHNDDDDDERQKGPKEDDYERDDVMMRDDGKELWIMKDNYFQGFNCVPSISLFLVSFYIGKAERKRIGDDDY